MTIPRPGVQGLRLNLWSGQALYGADTLGQAPTLTSACSDGHLSGTGGLQISDDASVQLLGPILEWELVSGSFGGPSGIASPPAHI